MDISGILEAEDKLFEQNRAEEVEELLIGAISVAADEGDGGALLQLLNELIGYYRESSRFEDAYKVADEIYSVASRILPEESVPFATSLLNIATAYRTGGRLEDAGNIYKRVENIYAKVLKPDDPLMASLYNNESLLYQEAGDFESAAVLLKKAIEIVSKSGRKYEEAVSRANLAATCMRIDRLEEGYKNAEKAIEIFRDLEVYDGHFAAALSAIGSYHYIRKEYALAADAFKDAMNVMESSLGKNAYYERIKSNYDECLAALSEEEGAQSRADIDAETDSRRLSGEGRNEDEDNGREAVKGIDICRGYYEDIVLPALKEAFPEWLDKLAVGLAGEGSDCYGYDDEISRDHDWGPEVCIWVTDDTYEKIGEKLEEFYGKLPREYAGYRRAQDVSGVGRRGIIKISDFCRKHLGAWKKEYEEIALPKDAKLETGSDSELPCESMNPFRNDIDWTAVSDASLSAFVNGEVWSDPQGIITALRGEVAKGYPESILYRKLAQACAEFSQAGQYNYLRCAKRGDYLTSLIMKGDALRAAAKIVYYAQNAFPPHDKWLFKGISDLRGKDAFLEEMIELLSISKAGTGAAEEMMSTANIFEGAGANLAMLLYASDIISDTDPYLDHHTEELMMKSLFSAESNEELTMVIAKAEFAAFDKVQNEGGRASCQNDWPTFGIMRRSQYLTWNRTMLLQYLYDFERETKLGHNLITEKYGRMMESTAPERYEEIKDNFPPHTEEQKAIIEEICRIQVGWMEEFCEQYPHLAGKARSVHTYDDSSYNTSYETYLRGEIGTYSDKMLQLYTKFIIELAQEGKNLARMTMENSCRLYGYESLEAAEKHI